MNKHIVQFFIEILLLLCVTTNAQEVYFGVGGESNLSYLQNKKFSFFGDEETSRKWKYYAGGGTSFAIGIIPLDTRVSPVFEFKTEYLYRRFGQEFRGSRKIANPPYSINYFVSARKKSHDITYSFLIGVKYKELVFTTGLVIEKFLKGSIDNQTKWGNSPSEDESFELGRALDDYLHLRYYWNFRLGYQFAIVKGFCLTPSLTYTKGFKTLNVFDTLSGHFWGYLNHASIGLRMEYSIKLKHKKNGKN